MDVPKLGKKVKFAEPFEIEAFFYPLPDFIFMWNYQNGTHTRGLTSRSLNLLFSQFPLFLSSLSLSLPFFSMARSHSLFSISALPLNIALSINMASFDTSAAFLWSATNGERKWRMAGTNGGRKVQKKRKRKRKLRVVL